MGFLSGSTTVVRFTAPVPARLDREAVATHVTRRAFRDLDPDGAEPHAFGWVAFHDPLQTDLTTADLFFHHFLVLGFRHDRRAVPAKLLTLERRRAENARKAELGRDRLGSGIRRRSARRSRRGSSHARSRRRGSSTACGTSRTGASI